MYGNWDAPSAIYRILFVGLLCVFVKSLSVRHVGLQIEMTLLSVHQTLKGLPIKWLDFRDIVSQTVCFYYTK